jgi:hypothetical protein
MNNKKVDLIEFLQGWKIGDWVWCIHCSRCYQVGEFRQIGEFQLCPYEDCDGDTVFDSWHWEVIQSNTPDYPVIPERSKIYLLYP